MQIPGSTPNSQNQNCSEVIQASVFLKAPQVIPMVAGPGNHSAVRSLAQQAGHTPDWLTDCRTNWNTHGDSPGVKTVHLPFQENKLRLSLEWSAKMPVRAQCHPPVSDRVQSVPTPWVRQLPVPLTRSALWSNTMSLHSALPMGNVIQGPSDWMGERADEARDHVTM